MSRQIIFTDELFDELVRVSKLYAHARSAKKIGSKEEAKAFYEKADKLIIKWGRKLVFK
jgi:hypothetical protein